MENLFRLPSYKHCAGAHPNFFSYTPFRLSADFIQLSFMSLYCSSSLNPHLCVVFLVTETNLVTLCACIVDVSMGAYITPDATSLLFSEVINETTIEKKVGKSLQKEIERNFREGRCGQHCSRMTSPPEMNSIQQHKIANFTSIHTQNSITGSRPL